MRRGPTFESGLSHSFPGYPESPVAIRTPAAHHRDAGRRSQLFRSRRFSANRLARKETVLLKTLHINVLCNTCYNVSFNADPGES